MVIHQLFLLVHTSPISPKMQINGSRLFSKTGLCLGCVCALSNIFQEKEGNRWPCDHSVLNVSQDSAVGVLTAFSAL